MGQDTYTGSPWEPWTQHLYSYVGNNPVNLVDPTGHVPMPCKCMDGGSSTSETSVAQAEKRLAAKEKRAAEEASAQRLAAKHREYSEDREAERDRTGTRAVAPLESEYMAIGWDDVFGKRVHPVTGETHSHAGVDLGTNHQRPDVHATMSGTVVAASNACQYEGEAHYSCPNPNNRLGNYVTIDHGNGELTIYAHLTYDSLVVTVGQTLTQGQVIGRVGSTGYSTGPHLHWEYHVNGVRQDPLTLIPNQYRRK